MLDELTDVLYFRVLIFLDERSLARATSSARQLVGFFTSSALWKQLSISRDPRASALGAPGLPFSLWRRGELPDWRGLCKWVNPKIAQAIWPEIDGDAPEASRSRAAGLWEDLLHSGGEDLHPDGRDEQGDAARPPREGLLWGGQSPHLFRLGPDLLISVAGGYYAERVGGAAILPLHDVALIELPRQRRGGGGGGDIKQEGSGASIWTCSAAAGFFSSQAAACSGARGCVESELVASESSSETSSPMDVDDDLTDAPAAGAARIRTLIPGLGARPPRDPRELDPPEDTGHPQTHGAASDVDVAGCQIIFFAGGAPHGQLTDETTALVLRPGGGHSQWGQAALEETEAEWQRWETVGERPSPRQGCRGVVFEGRFVIFGGREQGGGCLNDVWEISTEPGHRGRRMWNQATCSGQPPSPRVWYAACHASYGHWLVLGGSQWQFDEPTEPHDFRALYVLELREMCWSMLADPGPPAAPSDPVEPPWAVASTLVPLGNRQLLYLGGCMPHKVGPAGLTINSMRLWREWYVRLDRPVVYDFHTNSWGSRGVLLNSLGSEFGTGPGALERRTSEILLRSHLAAVYLPDRGSVAVLGGSRYFTGEYFHDLLELRLPPAGTVTSDTAAGSSNRADDPLVGSWGSGAVEPEEELETGYPSFLLRAVEGQSRVTRGYRGRIRSMIRDRILDA